MIRHILSNGKEVKSISGKEVRKKEISAVIRRIRKGKK